MATFHLPSTAKELQLFGVSEDTTHRIWAFSPRRRRWQLASAFLDVGYGRCHKHHMHDLEQNSNSTLTLTARLAHPKDTNLLYNRAYHCCCEMVVFTHANMHTNYLDQFPNGGRFIHNIMSELPMAKVAVPKDQMPMQDVSMASPLQK